METEGRPWHLVRREVDWVAFQLLGEEGLLTDGVLNDRLLLILLVHEVFERDFGQAQHLSEVCVLLVRILGDVLALNLINRFLLYILILKFLHELLIDFSLLLRHLVRLDLV